MNGRTLLYKNEKVNEKESKLETFKLNVLINWISGIYMTSTNDALAHNIQLRW